MRAIIHSGTTSPFWEHSSSHSRRGCGLAGLTQLCTPVLFRRTVDRAMSEFHNRISVLFSLAVAQLKGAQNLSDAFQILAAFIEDAMRAAAAELVEYAGPQKRELVLDYVGQLYDLTKNFIPLPLPLIWLRWVLGRDVVLLIAGGILEYIYARHKDTIHAH